MITTVGIVIPAFSGVRTVGVRTDAYKPTNFLIIVGAIIRAFTLGPTRKQTRRFASVLSEEKWKIVWL